MEKRDDPSNPSKDYGRMAAEWEQIEDILDGPAAIRAKGVRYLPKHGAEDQAEYQRRVSQAPWLPEFTDILQSLSSKPFAKEIILPPATPLAFVALAEDIDGRGNNLTTFARPFFRSAIAFGMGAILVDNTGKGTAQTLADERAANVRPYWVSIEADDIIDIKSAVVDGREVPYHVRIKECATVRNGYEDTERERIRELNREPTFDADGEIVGLGAPTWKVMEATTSEAGDKTWSQISNGVFFPLTEIPIAFQWTGDRDGPQFVRPPLLAISDKQIELYRVLARKDEAYTGAAYPMLTGNGMRAPPNGEKIEVGPGRILFAEGEQASWGYIQPNPEILRALTEDVEKTRDDMRRLGLQPLTAQSGGITATASSIEGAKAHSAVQAWALGLKDTIEQAFVFTAMWLNEKPVVEVIVHTDFLAGTPQQAQLDALFKARDSKNISRETYLSGLQRFDALPSDFDAQADELQLAIEMQGLQPEPNVDPATGLPLADQTAAP